MIKRIGFCAHVTRLMVGFANTGNQSGQTSRHARQRLVKPLLGGVLLPAVLVLASSSGQAALVTYEGFSYVASGPLSIDGQPSDGTQASNGWDNVTWGQFLGGATSYSITNGSLTDPSGLLFKGSNSVYTTGGFAGRFFATPAN